MSDSPISIDPTSADNQISSVPPAPTFTKPSTDELKNPELVMQVQQILQLPSTEGWEIVDKYENLALVHYCRGAEMTQYGHLRGILIDLEVSAVIANSFGYTPVAVANQLAPVDGLLSIKDQEQTVHQFDLTNPNTFIKRVHEGVVIREIWHKGQRLTITHRKIRPVKSRWGSFTPFMEMYEQIGKPTDEELFDTSKPYSRTYYTFLISHPELFVATRQKVSKPYLVCLGEYSLDPHRPADQVGAGKGLANLSATSSIKGTVAESFRHDPPNLSLEQANNHLAYGYYNEFEVDDPRLSTGEAVIIYQLENDQVTDVVKVHSSAYEWRSNLRGNNPNLKHQFYLLLGKAYRSIESEEEWQQFQEDLILFPLYSEQSLYDVHQQSGGILTMPKQAANKSSYSRKESRVHLLWINYLVSLPTHLQALAFDILPGYARDKQELVQWLQNLEKNVKRIDDSDLPHRVKNLITVSRRLAKAKVAQGQNFTAKGGHLSYSATLKGVLANLVSKEFGPSLYGLIREMKQMMAKEAAEVAAETK